MSYHIDLGDPAAGVCLGICECGARYLATSRRAALERLAWHEADTHTFSHARDALRRAISRENHQMSHPAPTIMNHEVVEQTKPQPRR